MSRVGSIIVTGASKGIGAALAAELRRRGRVVWGLSRGGDGPAEHNLICDVTDETRVRAAFGEIAAAGPIAALVNNAGVHIPAKSHELETALFERIMALNTTAVMVCAREVYPHLVAGGGGMILNMGSFFDRMGVPDNLAYCASKAAVAAMTRCWAVEWAGDAIQVINLAPGYIETDLNKDFLGRETVRAWLAERVPLGRPGTTDEVARLAAMLLAEDIPYLTGETIYMDGGQGVNH